MEEQTQQANLSISDIMLLKQILEISSSRGAFRAEEMSTVGSVYDRVTAWLATVTPAAIEEETDDETNSNQGEADA